MTVFHYSNNIHQKINLNREISSQNINIFVKLQNDLNLHVRNYKLNKKRIKNEKSNGYRRNLL